MKREKFESCHREVRQCENIIIIISIPFESLYFVIIFSFSTKFFSYRILAFLTPAVPS